MNELQVYLNSSIKSISSPSGLADPWITDSKQETKNDTAVSRKSIPFNMINY